jgi:hypothetical protein
MSGLTTTIDTEISVDGKVKYGNTHKFTLVAQLVDNRSELSLVVEAVRGFLLRLERELDQESGPRSGAV